MELEKKCPICGVAFKAQSHNTDCCERCRGVVNRGTGKKITRNVVISALKNAWDKEGHFRCHYSGVTVEEVSHGNPCDLTFDHAIPRKTDKIVVACALVNDMKSDMDEDEFRKVVIALAEKFKGRTFDRNILKNLKHYKRK